MFWSFTLIKHHRIKHSLVKAYDNLIALNHAFFDSYLTQDLLIKQSYKLYQKQTQWMKSLQHARCLNKEQDVVFVEKLHEVICSLHLLRFHFAEFALFEVCFQEMQSLQKTSQALLKQLKKRAKDPRVSLDVSQFNNAIYHFENLYSNTLQVVARDPQVFQFFIQDLYALHDLMMSQT